MFRVIVLALLAIVISSCAPKKYRVEFSDRPGTDDYHGRGLGQLYSFHTAEAKNSTFYQHLEFPENFEANDTAIMLLYYGGVPGVMNGISFLMADYKSPRFRVYPDRNNNLDFSDDGPPVVANPQDSSLRVYLSRANDSAAVVGVQLKKFRDNKGTVELGRDFQRQYFIPEELPILPARYWLWEIRLDTYRAQMELQGDSVIVGLCDFDFNGLFDKKGINRFNLVKKEDHLGFRPRDGAVILEDSALFHLGHQVYRITRWDSLGRFFEFVESGEEYNRPLKAGDPIPNVMVKTLEENDTAISALIKEKPFTLFNLWGSWCKGCHLGAESLRHASEKYREKLQIIGLNSGEPQFGLTAFLEKYQHNWPQYYVSSEFKEQFMVEGFPEYILVNSKGELLSLRAYPSNLGKWIEE